MGEVKIKSENLWNGSLISPIGGVNFIIKDDYMIPDPTDKDGRSWGYEFAQIKMVLPKGRYTICVRGIASTNINSGCDVYTETNVGLVKQHNLSGISLWIGNFTLTEDTNIGIMVKIFDGKYHIQLLEGTYTSETIPEYQPYFLNRPAHQVTNGQFVDIPTHHYINNRWQGELTSQSPLKFWADGDMLDWRIEGRTSGNLFDGTLIPTTTLGVTFRLDNNGYMYASPTNSDTRGWTYANSQIKVTLPSGNYTLCLSGTPSTSVNSSIRVNDDANKNLAYKGAINGQSTVIINFAVTDNHNIGIVAKIHDGRFRVRILKGTYTTQTIPPYEPYGGVGDWDETTQRYKIPVNVRSKNLFYIGTSTTDYTSPSYTNLTISNDTLSMKLSSESGMTYAVREQQQTQKGAVTFAFDTDCNTGIGIIVRIRDNDDTRWLTSSDTSISGFIYNYVYSGWYKWTPLNNGHPIQAITIPNVGSYYYVGILFAHSSSAVGNVYSATNIRLLEGTYTSETLPPYEPYINTTTNLYTDQQLMDGDSIDYTTTETQIPIATGNNILTVDTAVQPSKVFVKFEG